MSARIALLCALAFANLAHAGTAMTDTEDLIPTRLVETLYAGAGEHPGQRVNHARGVLLAGRFVASAQARALSRATILQGRPVAALLRFSNFGGDPDLADNDPRANPRGLALRLLDGDVVQADFVGHSANGFPARTPERFLAFLRAANAAPADPDAFARHLDANPEAKRFLAAIPPTPKSYISQPYYFMHAMALSAADGQRTLGRLWIEPANGVERWNEQEAATLNRDFLRRELAQRIAAGGVRLKLMLQLAGDGDALDDISAPWPAQRRSIELGTLTLDRIVADPQAQAAIMFDPARLPPGIEAAGDPMLQARSRAYEISLRRRSGQASTPPKP
ncbi:catalase [Lysobacter sp. K5869]|uniref:catalase n=1 Tax=Lysobacter sp. K5869 TaxID=2820808 RepID=UPI001C0610E7|nr:catalase [Lysobacter sp. K5869]QWP78970.1 catalase [Lysobacter sp. K5869]